MRGTTTLRQVKNTAGGWKRRGCESTGDPAGVNIVSEDTMSDQDQLRDERLMSKHDNADDGFI